MIVQTLPRDGSLDVADKGTAPTWFSLCMVQKALKIMSLTAALVLEANAQAVCERAPLSEPEAAEIAKAEVQKLGRDLNSLEMDSDVRWRKALESNPDILVEFQELALKLEAQRYWAIWFHPVNPRIRGGGITVFVDKTTGEIIGLIQWE